MQEVRVLRLTSSRPVYRRGGVQLSNAPLDIHQGDDRDILPPDAMLALLRDPVVIMRVSEDGENFRLLSEAERHEVAENIGTLIAASTRTVGGEEKIPDGPGSDTASAPDAAADQAKAGEVKDASAADTRAAASPASGEAGRSEGGEAEEGKAEKAAADAQPVEENNGGVDATPASVAAADPAPMGRRTPKGRGGTKI